MESWELLSHPDHPPVSVSGIAVRLTAADPNWLTLRWRIEGAGRIVVPPLAGKGRADGLWRTTCFELFAKPAGGDSYCEFNLSPSERWAAYDFASYREGLAERPVPRDPTCTLRRGSNLLIFDAAIPRAALPPAPWACGLSAVIEEEGGRLSYWALAHRPGKPDFHHPACFAASLPAPGGA